MHYPCFKGLRPLHCLDGGGLALWWVSAGVGAAGRRMRRGVRWAQARSRTGKRANLTISIQKRWTVWTVGQFKVSKGRQVNQRWRSCWG